MKKLLLFCAVATALYSCNDGDIITTTFDFGEANLESCVGANGYVFFNINNNASESVSLELITSEVLFEETDTLNFILDGSSSTVNYRQYDSGIDQTYFCNSTPPTSPAVLINYIGASGTASLITIALLDDDDGIDEDMSSTLDTDGDGLLNYYDFDDDGDNVPTSQEIGPDPENPMDTDSDGVPDYLDEDDDGDGVLTRHEDADGDLDPTNDFTGTNTVANYLIQSVANTNTINLYREHSYLIDSDIRLSLSDLVLINGEEEITQESLDMGEELGVLSTTKLVTPNFN